MEQLKKKNIGIPSRILTVLAYIIGYAVTKDYSILLAAILFAVLVFTLDFEDKVKNSVKQAYMICLVACIVELIFEFLGQLFNFFTPIATNYYPVNNVCNYLYKYGITVFHIAVIVVFFILAIMALLKKDITIKAVSNLFEDDKTDLTSNKEKINQFNQDEALNQNQKQQTIPDLNQEQQTKPNTTQEQQTMPNPNQEQQSKSNANQEQETVQNLNQEQYTEPNANQELQTMLNSNQKMEQEQQTIINPESQSDEFSLQQSPVQSEQPVFEKSEAKEKIELKKDPENQQQEQLLEEQPDQSEEEEDNRVGYTCTKCGMMNRIEAIYCSTCGTKLINS